MLSPFQSITLKKIIIAADCKASLEHQLRYKKDIPLDEAAQWKLRYCADLSAQLDERMKTMKKSARYMSRKQRATDKGCEKNHH